MSSSFACLAAHAKHRFLFGVTCGEAGLSTCERPVCTAPFGPRLFAQTHIVGRAKLLPANSHITTICPIRFEIISWTRGLTIHTDHEWPPISMISSRKWLHVLAVAGSVARTATALYPSHSRSRRDAQEKEACDQYSAL